jgi:hypothetical protein
MVDGQGAPLPNLVLAGVTKAGTTSLTAYLGQHPDIYVPSVKEINHFSPLLYGQPLPPLEDYRAHYGGAGGQRWRLDASPFYFVGGTRTATAVAATLERPRVVVTLRDPVDRLWSSYRYKRSKGYVDGSQDFGRFFDECLRHYESGADLRRENANFLTLRSGRYSDFLPAWLEQFDQDLYVLFAEELGARTGSTMASLFAWLDVDQSVSARLDLGERNVTAQPRSVAVRRWAHRVNSLVAPVLGSRPGWKQRLQRAYARVNTSDVTLTMDPADRERVREFYQPSVGALSALLRERGFHSLPQWLDDAPHRPTGRASTG